ncbi:MAG TPA: hypothetical protein VIA62_04930 [Thermoanaerobaculia bacterium]|jgi:hypothetical protein|nr:hypothetical protein [Thermoanaerobaculia bacterium]
MRFHRTTTLILLGSIALFGCKKKEEAPPPEATVTPAPVETPAPAATPAPVPFKVTSIDLGKAIGPDKKVTDPATTFGPKDTIYVVVSSEGTGPDVKLTAKWTFGDKGQPVGTEDKTVTPNGSAGATEFHASKKTGWPVGKYKVEILADGTSAGAKEFEVKK